MGRFRAVALSAILLCALSACTAQVQSNVTTFHTSEMTHFAGRKLAIEAFPPDRDQSLEFRSYREKLKTRFQVAGFTVVDRRGEADFVVFVSYGIDNGKTETSTYSVPEYGEIGGGTTTYQSGSVYTPSGRVGSYRGTAYTMPSYGVTGYSTQTMSTTLYTRIVAIDIVDAATVGSPSPRRVFEGRAKSEGICPSLVAVFDAIADAMLADFPGPNGGVRTLTVPWNGKC